MKASVKYKVIYRHKDSYSISEMCRFFEVSRSGYYDFVNRLDTPAKDLPLDQMIQQCQEQCRNTYGYRRVHIWLERQGVHKNPKTVLRIMRKYNLLAVIRCRKYKHYRDTLHRYPNLLNRNFHADRPNQKWVTDISEFKYGVGEDNKKGKLYLSVILDLCDRRPVAFVYSTRNDNPLVFDTFDKAVAANPGATPLLHSDRGYQYTSKAFRRRILAAGMTQSMSRVARCIDNGPMEGFWGLMKREMYYGKKYKTKEELMLAIEKYIDYYTNKRVQRNLGLLTPLEFHEQKLENVA